MKGVEQSPPHVADVWEHTLGVIRYLEQILAALAPEHEAEKNNDLLTGLLTLRLGRYRTQFAEHFAKALDPERSLRALLCLAALYHDVSKPVTKSVEEAGRIRFLGHEKAGADRVAGRARAFNLSNDEIERLRAIVGNHMRFHLHSSRLEGEKQPPSRKSIYLILPGYGGGGYRCHPVGTGRPAWGARAHVNAGDMGGGPRRGTHIPGELLGEAAGSGRTAEIAERR